MMRTDQEAQDKLERSVLDLGAELFHLKNEIYALKNAQHTFLEVLHGLKMILDEKGLINIEDFESAVELGQALSGITALDVSIENEYQRFKKFNN